MTLPNGYASMLLTAPSVTTGRAAGRLGSQITVGTGHSRAYEDAIELALNTPAHDVAGCGVCQRSVGTLRVAGVLAGVYSTISGFTAAAHA